MTTKDAIAIAGLISTSGTLGRKSYVSQEDATAVARLRGAGAIMLGATNVPELCLAGESDNLIYGRSATPVPSSPILLVQILSFLKGGKCSLSAMNKYMLNNAPSAPTHPMMIPASSAFDISFARCKSAKRLHYKSDVAFPSSPLVELRAEKE